MTVEAWCDEEAGVGPKCDSEEDLAGVDEGNQEELGLDEDQHHPAPPRYKFSSRAIFSKNFGFAIGKSAKATRAALPVCRAADGACNLLEQGGSGARMRHAG